MRPYPLLRLPRLALLVSALTCYSADMATVQPMSPPGLGVRLGAETLLVEAPETIVLTAESKPGEPLRDAPDDLVAETWSGALSLTPSYDPTHTHILGTLFRCFRPDSLRVESLDCSQSFQRDVDYHFREETGLVANLNGRISGPIRASVTATLQRLDLLQCDLNGRLSVKKGESSLVCPELPEPDHDHTGIAGIYVAPWTVADNPFLTPEADAPNQATNYAITAHEIFPIAPKPPVMPTNPERLGTVLGKLQAGQLVKIAVMGDSITLGAESTRWWNDKYDANSLTWKGRVIHTLRQRFPKSDIQVIEAYCGGVTIDYGLDRIDEVLSEKPDLIIASFGVNDAAPGVGKRTPKEFGEAMATLLDKSKAAGADTLWVVPFPLSPWMNNPQATVLNDQLIPVMHRTAAMHAAALADVNTAFRDLDARGIPWWSQHHNWHNHPGNLGHVVYAETILNCFPE